MIQLSHNPDAERVFGRFLDEREVIVRDALGIEFHQTVQVRERKPRWMPGVVYRWLWRTIITIDTPITTQRRHR